MDLERTQVQSPADRVKSQDLSLRKTQPPVKVPGYDPERLLGEGAYGEVWVATERNTGRKVAVKFYTHRGGLDWSLLKREVEKKSAAPSTEKAAAESQDVFAALQQLLGGKGLGGGGVPAGAVGPDGAPVQGQRDAQITIPSPITSNRPDRP